MNFKPHNEFTFLDRSCYQCGKFEFNPIVAKLFLNGRMCVLALCSEACKFAQFSNSATSDSRDFHCEKCDVYVTYAHDEKTPVCVSCSKTLPTTECSVHGFLNEEETHQDEQGNIKDCKKCMFRDGLLREVTRKVVEVKNGFILSICQLHNERSYTRNVLCSKCNCDEEFDEIDDPQYNPYSEGEDDEDDETKRKRLREGEDAEKDEGHKKRDVK